MGNKIIPRNFGHIGHINGSKMINDEDKLLLIEVQEKFIHKKQNKNDVVIVTEKIDGMNAGVVKKDGVLYAVNRKGYLAKNMGLVREELSLLGKCWDTWVNLHYDVYNEILKDGERFVFENCIIQHTLSYKFHSDPVFLLAKYNADGARVPYSELREIGKEYDLVMPPLLNYGCAIPPELVLNQYPNGLAGSRDEIEGIVYVYEHNGKFDGSAKYVSNNKMDNPCPILNRFNHWPDQESFLLHL